MKKINLCTSNTVQKKDRNSMKILLIKNTNYNNVTMVKSLKYIGIGHFIVL